MNAALDLVLTHERPASSRIRFGGILLLAALSHLVLGVAAASRHRPPLPPLVHETEIQALPDEPPPPPPPAPTSEATEPVKAATPEPAPTAPAAAAPPPAPAANVMTAPDEGLVDLTGGMVVGSAETFVGGAVTATSKHTRVGSAAGAIPSATATAASWPAPERGPDFSRSARLAEGVSWNCPFPPEADEAGVDAAVVGLSVELAASGDIVNVRVERDPGTGFGRVAVACARSKRFSPAQDRDGKPIAGRSRVNVRFQR